MASEFVIGHGHAVNITQLLVHALHVISPARLSVAIDKFVAKDIRLEPSRPHRIDRAILVSQILPSVSGSLCWFGYVRFGTKDGLDSGIESFDVALPPRRGVIYSFLVFRFVAGDCNSAAGTSIVSSFDLLGSSELRNDGRHR